MQALKLPQATHQIRSFGTLPDMPDRGDAELGRLLREAREAAKLSQVEAAAAVSEHLTRGKVSRGHISAVELGKRPAGRDLVFGLARLYDVSLDSIASRAGLAGDREAKDDYEATWLFIARELRGEEGEALQKAMLTRLRDKLHPS